jgi:hypothetical protein
MPETTENLMERQTFPLVTDAFRDEVARLGEARYEELRPRLEATQENQYVAIQVDTGEYEIARSSAEAMRLLRARFAPNGRFFARKIGNQPEYSLSARLHTAGVSAPK